MNERDFEILNVLAQTGNITKAAESLFVTQSALSKRISSIEEELGIILMKRSRHGIHFTPEGEKVLEYTRTASEAFADMRQKIESCKGIVSGTLKAGISINYSLYYLPDLLVEYRHLYPQVNLQIVSEHSRHIYQQLINNEIDVAIIRGDYSWTEGRILLLRDRICAITSSVDKDRNLRDIPYIGRKSDLGYERMVSQWLREHDLQPKTYGIHVDNLTTCVEMVSRGLGWAIVPDICLGTFSGEIHPLSLSNGEPMERLTYMFYSNDAIMYPQVKAFIDLAHQHHRI